ncbi:MAG: FAD-dependent oxidoreductase [Halopseudomonas aestusnigri]
MKRLIILGGGFAGLWAAMAAAGERAKTEVSGGNKGIKITLVSRDAYLVIRPRLYEGAGEDKRVLLKPLLDRIGVEFIQGSVEGVDPETKEVSMSGGRGKTLRYDSVILATGSQLKKLPVPGVEQYTFSADTYEDATVLDNQLDRIVTSNEITSKTLVIVGAGFTGLELATELSSRLKKMSDKDFRIVLVDRSVLAGQELGVNPKPYIDEALRLHDIELRMETSIKEFKQDCVVLSDGKVILTQTVVLATGLEASSLAGTFGEDLDFHGRLEVNPDLSIPGFNGAFAAGDVASAYVDNNHRTLLSCQHAIQLGRYAGYNALRVLRGKAPKVYEQAFYATCLDLGDWGALFTTGWDRVADKTGAEGKAMKQMINTQWIYPPSAASTSEEIFAFVSFEQEGKSA